MDIQPIFYSVAGGVVVLGLVWSWRNILPAVLQQFYHHEPSVAGRWNTTFWEGPQEYHEAVTVKQRGRRICGQIVLKLADEADAVYNFEGTFRYLIMTCTYQSTDPSEYEQGVFALRYRKGTFEGQHVLLSKESDNLISSDYVWERG